MIHIYIWYCIYIYDTVNVHNIYIMYVLGIFEDYHNP